MTRHPNFKGGSTASNGYRLIYVGKAHHLADVRGYAYEHRLVAEEKLGRRLRPGEVVHHKDGTRANNSPENLDVATNNGDHISQHFRKRSDLQPRGGDNPVIECACGCGGKFKKYDGFRRPRQYISGHALRGKKRAGGRGRIIA